ncbi:MAG: choice-of-anchor O protein, partial [Acidobacteriota bacterium]
TVANCDVALVEVSKAEALENLASGMKAGNLMKRNVSKTPGMKSDKAKLEILPVYVPARRSDGSPTAVDYYDADGALIETRNVAKPIVVAYLDEVEATGAMDVFVSVSRDDGETWKRRNISRTADKSSLFAYPGKSAKPMLKVSDDKIFLAWTDTYCRGGRPGYAITVCPADDPGCVICRDTADGTFCAPDYQGDDAYWQDDLFGVSGPQRSVIYEDYPELGEVPYSCVWTARGVVDTATGDVQWYKPERVTSGRRDAFQIFAGKGEDVAFAIVWQEDPKGLMPGEGDGPGDGWSGANTHNKADVWMSSITMDDFAAIDSAYPTGGHGDADLVDTDPELAGRVKALVPMSMPVKISDNDVCSSENMDPDGGHGDHDYDGEGEGTHRYCGTLDGIGTPEEPGANPLCAYTIEKTNPNGELHHVCVTADNRLLDGNTGASRPNVFLQPYKKPDGTKSAWVMIGYEESKGVGVPPEHDDDGCGDAESTADVAAEDDPDDRYKPDMGKNVIYHSFDLFAPETVAAGGILNLPETDAYGNPVYVLNEDGSLFLDWKGDPIFAYENARRVRFVPQPKSKAGPSGTVLVALYRQGEEGSGKPADIFMRRAVSLSGGNPYAFANFQPGAQNLSSVQPTELFQDPYDPTKPVKMLRWGWSPTNLADSSAKNPYTDARAHRGALVGDEVLIAYTWTPNWGRRANDKYDLYVRRSFNGGRSWTTDPHDSEAIEHHVVFRVPVLDEVTRTVFWDDDVVTTAYAPGASEPPRNVSNLRNNRTSVLEPRLVKTPGTIVTDGYVLYPEDEQETSVYQLAWGLEFNQNQLPDGVVYPKLPLDIYYGRTLDKGQRYESVIVTPQGGKGGPEDGWNLLAKDHPEQGAAQLRQTPDGSRMYGIWLEESAEGSDIMFRRVDYR